MIDQTALEQGNATYSEIVAEGKRLVDALKELAVEHKQENLAIVPEGKQIIEALKQIMDRSSVNVYDDPRVAGAIEATGCKKLIFAGLSLEVCAALPAMTAVSKGLDAYVAVDACGTFSETKRQVGLLRMLQAGVILSDYATLPHCSRGYRRDRTHPGPFSRRCFDDSPSRTSCLTAIVLPFNVFALFSAVAPSISATTTAAPVALNRSAIPSLCHVQRP